MEIDFKKVDINTLCKVTSFAKDKGILRTSAYRLIKENIIDYTIIDGVVFVVLNKKTLNYNK